MKENTRSLYEVNKMRGLVYQSLKEDFGDEIINKNTNNNFSFWLLVEAKLNNYLISGVTLEELEEDTKEFIDMMQKLKKYSNKN
jgi:hypothetical protein